ncbi:hypothetical protein NNC19_10185 [Clostridium sp. SHJSY1]|uniref:hypothetical protein n=1 Tax=Clostridium sp. SHJSY1 TaxID=2942483 RepID=UPI002876A95B|nr:hypothetical protein [Clostridium sp. SHJSY1]MDS0526048.1 hypothetical protein [Clostridium sp. SHJSY1]
MKKFINIMTIASAFITSVLIICTILTSYHFINIDQLINSYLWFNSYVWFNSYAPIQFGVSLTMTFLAFRFWLNEHGIKKVIYATLSLAISVISLLSVNIVK